MMVMVAQKISSLMLSLRTLNIHSIFFCLFIPQGKIIENLQIF